MKKLVLSSGIIVFTAAKTQAANFAVITNPPTMLNILILFFAGACLYICYQVLSLVKGGQLSKSWQLFMLAFGLLTVSQVTSLLNSFEILVVPGFVVPVMMVLMVGLFLYGMYETKRVLS